MPRSDARLSDAGSGEAASRLEALDRFRSAFETAAHGMAIVALDGRFIEVNRALCDILGYSADELCARNFQSITHPGDLDADIGQVTRLLAGKGLTYEIGKRYLHKEGRIVDAWLSVGLIRDKAGGPLYFVSQIYDVSERQRLEAAHREAEAALARAQKLVHLAYYRWSLPRRCIISHNDEYLKILGVDPATLSEAELIGVEPYLHPEDRERVMAAHRAAEAEGRGNHLAFRIVRPDGAVRYLLDLNEPDPSPGAQPQTWSGTIQDITPQMQQAEALRAYQARLELALETARAAYWELDVATQTYSSGAEYFSLLGYSAEEATTQKESWLALIHPEDRQPITEEHLLAPNDRGDHVIEYRIKSKSGEWRWLQSHFRASAFDNLGRPSHLLGIDIDITEQKNRQAELIATRALVADAARRARIAFWRQEFGFGSMVWSGAAAELLGRPADMLPATTEEYLKLVHREDVERVRAAYVQARAHSKAYELEYRVIRSDGIIWFNEIGQIDPATSEKSATFAGTVQDITERKNLESRLEQLATVDELTGAQNRRAFMTLSQIELRRAQRFKRPLSFLFLDIDHFKQINDQHGHRFGDLVLATLSTVCRSKLRPSDVFARYGGEEFIVMLPETDIGQADVVAQRLTSALHQTVFGDEPVLHGIGVSIGISAIRNPQDTIGAVLERMDRGLYRAKANGRDRIEIEP